MDGVVISLDVLGRRIVQLQAERDEAHALAVEQAKRIEQVTLERDQLAGLLTALASPTNGSAPPAPDPSTLAPTPQEDPQHA